MQLSLSFQIVFPAKVKVDFWNDCVVMYMRAENQRYMSLWKPNTLGDYQDVNPRDVSWVLCSKRPPSIGHHDRPSAFNNKLCHNGDIFFVCFIYNHIVFVLIRWSPLIKTYVGKPVGSFFYVIFSVQKYYLFGTYLY
jgi:hypothetical protein